MSPTRGEGIITASVIRECPHVISNTRNRSLLATSTGQVELGGLAAVDRAPADDGVSGAVAD
jgi:hypothetical protein